MHCFYHPDYFLPLPPGHPFPMEKFPEAYALVRDRVIVREPTRLTFKDLCRAHAPAYLRAVSHDRTGDGSPGLTSYERNRLGLPAHPRLLERSMWETAGTVAAALAALENGLAANLAGGTHHAFPERGTGYCVLNDIAVAVEFLRARTVPLASVLIIDTDAHQGNANHAYFANDPTVFTYSIHVGKNYPARKEPGDCDVPLERYADGGTYLAALDATLPGVIERTEPDLVFWISGVDPHEEDRFGQLKLRTEDLAERDAMVLRLCRACAAPLVVVYGGGYHRRPGMTSRLHSQTILAASRVG